MRPSARPSAIFFEDDFNISYAIFEAPQTIFYFESYRFWIISSSCFCPRPTIRSDLVDFRPKGEGAAARFVSLDHAIQGCLCPHHSVFFGSPFCFGGGGSGSECARFGGVGPPKAAASGGGRQTPECAMVRIIIL